MFFTVIVCCIALYLFVDWVIRIPKVGDYRSKYVFVTGCDSGFGRDFVQRLDRMGFRVFAACLTEKGISVISRICSDRVIPLSLDVTKSDSIQAAYKKVKESLPNDKGLWAVVNNAGVPGFAGATELIPIEDHKKTCAVNLFGPIEVSKTFAPLLRKSQGRLITISSAGGLTASGNATYTVSKFALEGFCDICRREMAKSGIKVCIIEPGFFTTSFMTPALFLKGIHKNWNAASADLQDCYGNENYLQLMEVVAKVGENDKSTETYLMGNAYVAAITSKWPQTRYRVGVDAKFLFTPLSYLPEWLTTTILWMRFIIGALKLQRNSPPDSME